MNPYVAPSIYNHWNIIDIAFEVTCYHQAMLIWYDTCSVFGDLELALTFVALPQ